MIRHFLTAAAVTTALLFSCAPAMAAEVLVPMPIICDHRETILDDAASLLDITHLAFMGDIIGDGGYHYELWTDTEEKAWVAILVSTENLAPPAGSPDGTVGEEITIACVMGTGGEHLFDMPKAGDPV